MTAKKYPAKLDLGMSQRGGHPQFYARNIQEHGDWATVGFYVGDITETNEIYIEAYKGFKEPGYINQMKDHLLKLNPGLKFSCDQVGGSFVNPDDVIEKCASSYKLMSFEIDAIKSNKEILHKLYLAAKPEKQYSLPRQFEYQNNNSLYPFIQAFSAVTQILHG